MNYFTLYVETAYAISKLVTKSYSTSFYFSTVLLPRRIRRHIFNIYGFVRLADEIVDTFHDFDKKVLLDEFERDLYLSFERGISLNPILHSFQDTVRKYAIPIEYIQAFLKSMRWDLEKKDYLTKRDVKEYIYGSADVIGLMCLKVFCEGNEKLFDHLKEKAVKLGSAFQKVNFLRDLSADITELGRKYFVELSEGTFDEEKKASIVREIEEDFLSALEGIKLLPKSSKLAVYTAYLYYTRLLKKIKRIAASDLLYRRTRISNFRKLLLLLRVFFEVKLGLI